MTGVRWIIYEFVGAPSVFIYRPDSVVSPLPVLLNVCYVCCVVIVALLAAYAKVINILWVSVRNIYYDTHNWTRLRAFF